MKTQAAVLWEPGQPWQIEELELDPPKHGEVLLQLAASGMCHSDEHVRDGSVYVDLILSAAGVACVGDGRVSRLPASP
ncbi:hypothetical protein MLGJGCBP_01567 [Rhodococcus sp. T7]|nr:hypothetical protein MLGJGCBP_01567 [Rhodococcus sp. T7]